MSKLWSRWEVFNPVDGIPIYSVPFGWICRLIIRFVNNGRCLDYDKAGKGW